MKTLKLFSTMAFLAVAIASANATGPQAKVPNHDHAMPMPGVEANVSAMAERAQKAKTPSERSKLMNENMITMKLHMSEMKSLMAIDGKMMDGKSKPMTMDPAHMEKMQKHMTMMHDMMESLIIQQELMMKVGYK